MTIKTFTTTLLLTASFLLFTACNSKSESETSTTAEQSPTTETDTNTGGTDDGTSSDGGGDDNATAGGTDGNTTAGTGGGADDNTTAAPTITLTSLKLTIEKTSLNRNESTTVKVMAAYSDQTSKDVTEEVEWIVAPSGAARVTSSTLTALQDKATTVKVKIDTVTSDAVTLNITWVVNGHVLPPEPDKVLNDSTLLGIDVNDNNVRDDVERWIYETYKDKHPIHIDIGMQAGRAYNQLLKSPLKNTDQAKNMHKKCVAPIACKAYYQIYAKYFNEPLLVTEDISVGYFQKFYFNTPSRKKLYSKYSGLLSGGMYSTPKLGEGKNLCDFDVSKYKD